MLGTRLALMAAIHQFFHFKVKCLKHAMGGFVRKLTVSMQELRNMRPAQTGSSG
jgi:hypothetical protein